MHNHINNGFRPFEVISPATTANLGPGFDCLGMALDLWNRLEVIPVPAQPPSTGVGAGLVPARTGGDLVHITGEGTGVLATDATNLTFRSMLFLFDEAGLEMPSLRLRCHNVIPLSRGMGSSAAAIAGGLVAANHLCGNPYSANELLEMAATIEGHPDNVAAAVLGGLQLVVSDTSAHPGDPSPSTDVGAGLVPAHPGDPSPSTDVGAGLVPAHPGDPSPSADVGAGLVPAHPGSEPVPQTQLYTAPIPVPEEIQAVLFIPDTRIATADARAVLPGQVTMADAVFNMGRVALLVAGMALDRPEYLDVATQDRLHQPYRQPLLPAIKLLFAAARNSGALGVFLSGSGSTVLALTRGREMTVAYEMFEAARLTGTPGRLEITRPTTRGAHVVNQIPSPSMGEG